MQPRYWNVQDERGNAVPGAQVTIRKTLDQSIASIFDPVSGAALSNPFTVTDSGGEFGWTAGDGKYDEITVTRPGVPADTKKGVLLFDPFTDGGSTGFWPDITPSTKILRLRDRVFVGAAAAATGNRNGTQGSIFPDATAGANWALRDSQFLSIAQQGLIAVAGISRSGDLNDTPTESIGVAGFVQANNALTAAWGLYSDVQFESGTYGYGLEVAAKNKGSNQTSTPYFQTTGVYGIWLPGGGDPSYGGAAANPGNTAIAIGSGGSTWNKGLVFFKDGLTGDDGTTGTATAIEMAKGHQIRWGAPGNFTGFTIRSDISAGASDMTLLANNSTLSVLGVGGANLVTFAHQASAVNYWQLINRATGSPPLLQVLGTDNDIVAGVQGKGVKGVALRAGDASTKFEVNTTGIGFYGTAPVAKPAPTGSRAGNAALASLLTALASQGLITDSTSA
jgi:hypothetical protein